MKNNPENGTLLKNIDTIISELNALCAAQGVHSEIAQPVDDSNPRAASIATAAAGREPVKDGAPALLIMPAHAASQTAINASAPISAPPVELAVEYYATNGRVAARCAATDTAHQLWERCVGELGQCSNLVLHPYLPEAKPGKSRLSDFEKFYHSTTALLNTPIENAQQATGLPQSAGANSASVNDQTAKTAFYEDILPSEEVAASVSVPPAKTADPEPLCRVLMLNSHDGAEYAWPVLYPSQWKREEAILLAKSAVAIVKAEDRLAVQDGEPGISNYRHRLVDELRVRGFIVPETDEGPLWD